MRALTLAGLASLLLAAAAPVATAAEGGGYEAQDWSFSGLFGGFDRAELRRGFKVYTEVCAGCHSLRLLSYRNLRRIGFGEDEVKRIAANVEVTDGPNEEGEMYQRAGRPGDRFVSPFANDQAARAANNGALPPDLSLITKSRVGGADYVHGVLVGYRAEPPEGVTVGEGMVYNAAFPGGQIAMPPPLSEDAVEYADGTKATVGRMAKDVVAFLAWAAEPELEERKRIGIKVVLFLIVFTGLLYAVKRRVWADVH